MMRRPLNLWIDAPCGGNETKMQATAGVRPIAPHRRNGLWVLLMSGWMSRLIGRWVSQSMGRSIGKWMSRPVVGSFALVVLVATMVGCGYTTRPPYPDHVRTVSVRMFENRSFERGVEYDLQEALVKEIELRTPYKVAAEASADTQLSGSISDVDRQRLSRRRGSGVVEGLEYQVTVDFDWADSRSGDLLRQRRGFQAVGRYVPTAPIGEQAEVGRHSAVQRLAELIVSTMRDDW